MFKSICAIVAAIATMGFTQSAAALDLTNPAFIQIGEATSIPVGHFEFCRSMPDECRPNSQRIEAVALTPDSWQQLVRINMEVNAAVAPVTDQDQYAVEEFWTYPAGAGDCEDYVLEKRRQLVASGWARSTLLIAVVRQQNNEGHAVLVVRTDRGDLVLDNQDGDIHVWNETPYTYIKRQSQADAGQWVDVLDTRAMLVASAH